MSQEQQEAAIHRPRSITLVAAALLTVILAATYWSAMAALVRRWYGDPDYTYGFLVPVFAGVLLWYRREMLQGVEYQGSFWGLLLLAVAGAMRIASAYYYFDLLDPASLIPCLAGITLFAGGRKAMDWAWPAIAFLVFMIPLPGFLSDLMGGPLRELATAGSTFVIQTLGIPSVAEGNVILLSDSQVGVAEACNGLRNMMMFMAMCVGFAAISRRTPVEKVIIVVSAAVLALVANVVRIAATAILHSMASHQAATTFYHDLAGAFMIPLAALFLWLELVYLDRVFVPQTASGGE